MPKNRLDRRYVRNEKLIISAVGRILFKRRAHWVSIHELVAETRLSRATIYRHYKNFDDFCIISSQTIIADIRTYCATWRRRWQQLDHTGKPLATRRELEQFLHGLLCLFARHRDILLVLSSIAYLQFFTTILGILRRSLKFFYGLQTTGTSNSVLLRQRATLVATNLCIEVFLWASQDKLDKRVFDRRLSRMLVIAAH